MNKIEIYTNKNNETSIEVKFDDDTVWLSLNQISEVFARDKSVISRHIKKIFDDNELSKNSAVAKNATTASGLSTLFQTKISHRFCESYFF